MAQEDPITCIVVTPRGGLKPLAIFVSDRCGVRCKALAWIINNKKLIHDDVRNDLKVWLALHEEEDTNGSEGKALISRFLRFLGQKQITIKFDIHADMPLSFWTQKW